jgi:hypothetical protein
MSTVSVEQLPEQERALVKRALELEISARDKHDRVCEKADRFYGQYRSYTDAKRALSGTASQNDRDAVLNDIKHGFGADLFIPYTFSIVETTLARALANNPTMQVKAAPTSRGLEALMTSEENADNHRVLLERQMAQTKYNLTAQDIAKESFITGLGVGKTFMEEKVLKGRKVVVPATVGQAGGPAWTTATQDREVYRGPRAEWVSIYDAIFDGAGHDIETCRWVIHRFWIDNFAIKDKIEQGTWKLPAGVKLDDVLQNGSEMQRNDLWRERMKQGGFDNPEQRGDVAHEGWEVWDRATGNVVKIIDRAVPVEFGDWPSWAVDLPFQISRPTKVPGELYGIGEPEAIEDLQEEMNIFRRTRRDNALFVLQRPFAYFRGMVEEADLAWGPGVGIPVDGDPKDLLFFPPMQEVPNSSYQDAEAFARDIERTTGIDDTGSGVAGTGGANATATGVMEVQRAAGLRVALKTLRFESEMVKEQSRCFLEINQQKIGIGTGDNAGADEPLFMFGPPRLDDPDGVQEGRSVYEMGPKTLAGEFDVGPVESSMAPQNTLERQQRGLQAFQTFGADPYIEPVKLREFALENMGFDNPRGMIITPGEQITPEELAAGTQAAAAALGMDPAQLAEMLAQGIEQAKAAEEQQVAPGAAAAAGQAQQQAPPQPVEQPPAA